MFETLSATSIRTAGALAFAIALAIPVTLAHAGEGGGGRDPQPASSTQPTASEAKPQQATRPASTQTRSAIQTKQRAPTTSQTKRQTRRATPRVVETAPSGLPPDGETRFIPNEVIVRFQLSSTARERDRAIRGLGMTHVQARTFVWPGVTVHRYRLSGGLEVREVITRLEASAAVVTAQPNYLYLLQQGETTGKLPQFANDRIDLSDAHARTKGGSIRVAVIDTAVDAAHPEFSTAQISVHDVSDGGSNVDPHGTSIAGILAADAKLTGVAPEAQVISIAAFANDASGTTTGNTWTILEATNVAHAQNVNIVNMSFAGPPDPLLEQALIGAQKRNVLPVAAAGNAGPDADMLFPAGYDTVIAVTATDTNDNVYSKANTGAHVDIAAPGVDLLVLSNASGFRTSSGTSMATAYVSGIAALALSANPGADYTTLRTLLENSTTDLGQPGKDAIFGAGLPSAAAAIGGLTN